jgi:RND superfamily putative drug exporter
VLSGFTGSARVVTAAAIIMISVFAAFVPHGDASVQPIAFGLAVGVFVDAFLVRMTLVPAVMALMGDRAWWLPGWLDRRLPALDVEGAGIEKHVEHEEWVERHGSPVVRAEGLSLRHGRDVLVEGIDLVLRPGELLAVPDRDPVRRRAFLAALSGRLDHADGRLVVLGRVLPAEATGVRRRVALHERVPTTDELDRLTATASDGLPTLVVVDDVDAGPDEEEVARRWQQLRRLTLAGATVVAGCSVVVPRSAGVLDLATSTHWTSETTPEEATV